MSNGDSMFEYIDDLKLLSVVAGQSVVRKDYTDRASHVFIFKVSGSSTYRFGERQINLNAGQILFIPQGASYRVEKISEGESRYVLLNFTGALEHPVPKRYEADGFSRQELIHTELERLWLLGTPPERYQCQAEFFRVLAFVSRQEQAGYARRRRLDVITPGVDYLREHLFDPDLKVGQLSGLCGVSDTYFRTLFQAGFGMKPQEYVTNKRLGRAAAILDSGMFDSVAEVAGAVGYTDPLYFSRIFARMFSVSPTAYAHIRK